MGRKYRFQSTINTSRDVMIAMLTSCEFLETEARENGAVDVSCSVRRRGKHKLSLTLRKADPTLDDEGRPVEGKLDHIVMKQEWDTKKGAVEWTHEMEELEGVKVSGRNEIRADGDSSCILVEEGEIEVRTGMPWVGWFMDWFIAGRVIGGMKAERARRARYLAEKAKSGG